MLGVIGDDHVDHQEAISVHRHLFDQVLEDMLLVSLQLRGQLFQTDQSPIFIHSKRRAGF